MRAKGAIVLGVLLCAGVAGLVADDYVDDIYYNAATAKKSASADAPLKPSYNKKARPIEFYPEPAEAAETPAEVPAATQNSTAPIAPAKADTLSVGNTPNL